MFKNELNITTLIRFLLFYSILQNMAKTSLFIGYFPRADGAKRRARELIPPGYLHPGKRKH